MKQQYLVTVRVNFKNYRGKEDPIAQFCWFVHGMFDRTIISGHKNIKVLEKFLRLSCEKYEHEHPEATVCMEVVGVEALTKELCLDFIFRIDDKDSGVIMVVDVNYIRHTYGENMLEELVNKEEP